MSHDIVYILKNGINSEELRYSLRSVEANFPYNKIWFYGGVPTNVKPDRQVEVVQKGEKSWDKTFYTIKQVLQNDEITEDFWLFNDDFFVMKKIEGDIPPYVNGSIARRVDYLKTKYNKESHYAKRLKDTAHFLKVNNYDRLSYALHIPMLINREKANKMVGIFGDKCTMFRSVYGNVNKIGGVIRKDVKITRLDVEPDPDSDFLSTHENSFREGRVGIFIKNSFPDPIWREIDDNQSRASEVSSCVEQNN